MTSAVPRRAYSGATVAAAALATFFFPLLSLIAALFLLGRERDEAKRRDLRLWAWGSVGWILAQVLVFAVLACAVFSSSGTQIERSGPCVGGPQLDEPATVQPDGTAVVPCELGGTATITVP